MEYTRQEHTDGRIQQRKPEPVAVDHPGKLTKCLSETHVFSVWFSAKKMRLRSGWWLIQCANLSFFSTAISQAAVDSGNGDNKKKPVARKSTGRIEGQQSAGTRGEPSCLCGTSIVAMCGNSDRFCLSTSSGLVASSLSSNTTGLDMASILQNKFGQKNAEEVGRQLQFSWWLSKHDITPVLRLSIIIPIVRTPPHHVCIGERVPLQQHCTS